MSRTRSEPLSSGPPPARVLVVDDEFGVREGCRRILSEEGYEVITAEDGQAGLEAFQANPGLSVVLVDMMMPRMGGLDLLRRIRETDPEVVVIIVTAHATIDSAVEGTKQGAYSYIPKPFTPDELLLTIRNGLERLALSREAQRLREERERRLLEVASERSRSNTIIKCMTDGVLVINVEKLIVLRNAAAAHILPETASRSVPFPLRELQCPELRGLIGEVLEGAQEPQILGRELPLNSRTYMVNVSPVLEPNGEISGAVAVFRDISELKKLETAKNMFVSMVAHEVKNPLAATEGWLNLILSGMAGQDPAEERHMIERSLLRIRTLRTLVSELLNLTAIETGNFTLRRALVDLPSLAQEAVEACREKAAERQIRLTLAEAPAATHEKVLADRNALLMILTNLVDNAVKYTPPQGRVDVSLERSGLYLAARVRDTGIGMGPEEAERAFDEFYRAKNEYTADVPGTGLGLSLSRRLAEMHQGRIELESVPGEGSTFTLCLPLQ